MLDRLVRNAKLPEVMPHHFRLDLDCVELLARINANHAADHFRDNNHIAKVRFNGIWLLVGLRFLLSLTQLLNEAHRLAFQAAIESAASARVNNITELFTGEIEQPGGK